MAPAATVIVTAVTDAVSAPPMPYVPDVDAENVPKYVAAVVPGVVNDAVPEFVLEPDDAAFHVIACLVVDPSSFAPVVDGDALCSCRYARTFVVPPDRASSAWFSEVVDASAMSQPFCPRACAL
jgi:hypothetical protein